MYYTESKNTKDFCKVQLILWEREKTDLCSMHAHVAELSTVNVLERTSNGITLYNNPSPWMLITYMVRWLTVYQNPTLHVNKFLLCLMKCKSLFMGNDLEYCGITINCIYLIVEFIENAWGFWKGGILRENMMFEGNVKFYFPPACC